MKANPIARIIIYSIVIILLLGILLGALGVGNIFNRKFLGDDSGVHSGSITAQGITDLSIDWAAGSITIVAGDIQEIQFTETGDRKYSMQYEIDDRELQISYSDNVVARGSAPEKDLTITVPKDWICNELELDVAGVEVDISGFTTRNINCDGAGVDMDLALVSGPVKIDIDGVGCDIDIHCPEKLGFLVETEGLGCEFNSNVEHTSFAGSYYYGNKDCQLYVDGLGCSINIELMK